METGTVAVLFSLCSQHPAQCLAQAYWLNEIVQEAENRVRGIKETLILGSRFLLSRKGLLYDG